MASASVGGTSLSFEYDIDGLRTKKAIQNGETYNYYYSGGKLLSMTWENGEKSLNFLYDGSGNPYSVVYKYTENNIPYSSSYYYVTNLQGDVIAILAAGHAVVAEYTYDAWGNILSVTNSSGTDISGDATHIANLNPLRYRGYVYDTETGFYYLQSRYYDPAVCRFLNSDSQLNQQDGMLGYNTYAYCQNNPVMYSDPDGHSITLACIIVGAVIGAAVGGYIGARVSKKKTGKVKAKSVVVGAVGGAAVGALVGWGVGAAVSSIGTAVAGGTSAATAGTAAVDKLTQNATNAITSSASTNVDPVKIALKQLSSSGLRPGQTEISRSKIMELVNNFDPVMAESRINSIGGTRYLVDGHHTTVASTILGRGTCMNMGVPTNQLPSATDIYWSKQWYEFYKTSIKIIE